MKKYALSLTAGIVLCAAIFFMTFIEPTKKQCDIQCDKGQCPCVEECKHLATKSSPAYPSTKPSLSTLKSAVMRSK